jgi:predicted transcriptional regulator/adenylate kinase
MQESSAVIISLHPEHANKILSGEKRLEFRRVWATKPVNAVVIYSTVPVKKIVAIAYVKKVHLASPTHLWSLAQSIGGGLSRRSLYKYFEGKKQGYAIEFDAIKVFNSAINPESFIKKFRAPQSFTYIDQKTLSELEGVIMNRQEKAGTILFVAGVHGVGKSSMCEAYAKKFGALYKSASQLIREAKAEAVATNSKAVQDIDGNQQLLIQAVSKIRAKGKNLLLDGHFAILNAEHQPTPLSTDVFANLYIDSIVAIYDEPSLISSRMVNRDGDAMSEAEVDSLQTLEISRAEQVSDELKIPFVKLKALHQNSFD